MTPTISANIPVTVPTTTLARIRSSSMLGNTGGNNGFLDSPGRSLLPGDDPQWSLCGPRTNSRSAPTGVASTAATSRNATRWYEFQNLTTTPTLVQSGTVFDNAATRAAARQYWIPSVIVTGQGHAVVAFSMAGTPSARRRRIPAGFPAMRSAPWPARPARGVVTFGTTTANYNPPSDPGGASGRRWGDYSFTVVDPLDDMSVWTIQEYNQASNSYAVRVGQLLAPPPATPTCSGTPISFAGRHWQRGDQRHVECGFRIL